MTLLIPNLLNKKYTDSQGLVAVGQAESDSNTLLHCSIGMVKQKKIIIHEISIFRNLMKMGCGKKTFIIRKILGLFT